MIEIDSETDENLRTIYKELCTSYRAIDDFRAKLLGFLPLATGTGLFLVVDMLTSETKGDTTKQFLGLIGIVGFFTTLGFFFYEIYGIKKCHAVILAGKRLEAALRINDGQFTSRPRGLGRYMNEPFAAGVIYPIVLAVWTFLVMIVGWSQAALSAAIFVFIAGFAWTVAYNVVFDSGLIK